MRFVWKDGSCGISACVCESAQPYAGAPWHYLMWWDDWAALPRSFLRRYRAHFSWFPVFVKQGIGTRTTDLLSLRELCCVVAQSGPGKEEHRLRWCSSISKPSTSHPRSEQESRVVRKGRGDKTRDVGEGPCRSPRIKARSLWVWSAGLSS